MTHEVTLINHACLLHEVGGLRLITDPWLSGRVFADGWELVVQDGTTIESLAPDVIWLSHEHPDHFSPADLGAAPEEMRARIKVVTRLADDRKVASYCRAKGYDVLELPQHTWVDLSDDVRVMTGAVDSDSWLAVTDGTTTVLNVNDCQTDADDDARIAELVGPVDLLATQFSYASWVGNPGDAETPRKAAGHVIDMVAEQLDVVRPRQVLLFAAFVRFGHSSNAWWNDYAPHVDQAVEQLAPSGIETVVLFPGDRHVPGQPGPVDAADRWRAAYAEAERRPLLPVATPVPVTELNRAWAEMSARLREDNDWDAVERDLRPLLEPAVLRLSDLGLRVVQDVFADELAVLPDDADDWDLETTSDVFEHVMKQRWGRGTLVISGRLKLRYATAIRFFRQSQIYYANNLSRSYPDTISTAAVLSPTSVALSLIAAGS